jgi:penicillin amidase
VNRLLRYVNAVIALALLAALAAAYWTLWRPLPKTSGRVETAVSKPVQVVRDERGVPHITAATIEDALFAQGYVTAQDRLWQMDGIRRLAAGQLAEIVGPGALESDRDARRLRLRRLAEEHARTMPAEDKRWFAAYARGVNAYIEEHRGNLPIEFRVLRYQPRPWEVADTITVGLQMHRSLTTTWREEMQKFNMMAGGDAAKVNQLFPSRTGREPMPGSNAWAINGAWTATGKPILANDPHLESSLPSPWYQIHLKAEDLDVAGMSLPGAPAVLIGHNQRIAWGVTNLGYDVQDLYLEKIDPSTGRYLVRGEAKPAIPEIERIAVKGAAPTVYTQWLTEHGPVAVIDGQWTALRWTAGIPGSFQFPFVDLGRARDWPSFRNALRRFPGPGLNFVYADVDGNIGHQAAGLLPIRPRHDGSVPVDGSSGEFEWAGMIPFDELPSTYNPARGIIVSANQNPWPPSAANIHGQFSAHWRAKQILDRLQTKKGWKATEMVSIQTDVYSAYLHQLARAVAGAADRKGKSGGPLGDPVALLKEWNGQMDRTLGAPLIAHLTEAHLSRAIANRASPGKGNVWGVEIGTAVIHHLVTSRPRDWFDDWDQVLVTALQDAVEEGSRMQGSNVRKWRWGVFLEVTIAHPIFGRIAALAPYWRLGPEEMSGGGTTLKQTTRRLSPSMRYVADLADWEGSFANLAAGQSGHVLSRHFKDQWDAYRNGISFPMPFANVPAKTTLELIPRP